MSSKEAAQTEQEASLLARMSHPGIVAFWESFVATSSAGEKRLYICMEFAGRYTCCQLQNLHSPQILT